MMFDFGGKYSRKLEPDKKFSQLIKDCDKLDFETESSV